MKLRMFTRVGVISATGKRRSRNVSARKCVSIEDLVRCFEHNLRFVTDPTIQSIRIDVRRPSSNPELKEFENDPDGDFSWQHDAKLSAEVAGVLKNKYPELPVTIGYIFV